jgi:hypothetical protein
MTSRIAPLRQWRAQKKIFVGAIQMSGGISSTKLIYFELFSFKYDRITLKFQKLSGGYCPHSAVLGSAPALRI